MILICCIATSYVHSSVHPSDINRATRCCATFSSATVYSDGGRSGGRGEVMISRTGRPPTHTAEMVMTPDVVPSDRNSCAAVQATGF